MAQQRLRNSGRIGIEKTKFFVLGVLLLLLLGFLMSLIRVFSIKDTAGVSYSFYLYEIHGSWLLILSTILHVVAIALLLHHIFGFVRSPQIYLCICVLAGVIALLLLVKWIAGYRSGSLHWGVRLTVGGWLMLVSELGAAVLCFLCYSTEQKE